MHLQVIKRLEHLITLAALTHQRIMILLIDRRLIKIHARVLYLHIIILIHLTDRAGRQWPETRDTLNRRAGPGDQALYTGACLLSRQSALSAVHLAGLLATDRTVSLLANDAHFDCTVEADRVHARVIDICLQFV